MKRLNWLRTRRCWAITAAATTVVAGTAGGWQLASAATTGCSVTYTIANQWSSGFGASVVVTNLGDPIDGWRLGWSFSAGQTVTQLWNGGYTQSGAQVTVTDAGYNKSIATNASVSFGFNGAFDGSNNPAPGSFTLNGATCTGRPDGQTSSGTGEPPVTTTPPTTQSSSQTTPTTPTTPAATVGGRQVEALGRGVVSVRSGNGNLVSWRLLATDPAGVGFNVYRDGTKVNSSPVTTSTNYLDAGAAAGSVYTVKAVVDGAEQAASDPSLNMANGYLDVPISSPGGSYAANDASVADLDGDGQYEIVLKWDPADAKDNSQAGVTSNVYLDAYELTGTRLWRVNLGRNIRAGAHYTQFQVYDYDGDGKAEMAVKTADGTVDGTGKVIGNASADYRNAEGYVLTGPEYLTMFNGQTGAAVSTVNYDPPRGTVSSWGDNYGNRVDRFLAATAYLDGARPSLIMSRGYYTRAVIAAWDFRNGTLTKRWTFDTNAAGNSAGVGQGNHNLSIADVDRDGRDEIVFGALCVDDNGRFKYSTGMGHGDAMHVGDLVPSRTGLEVFKVNEDKAKPGSYLADANTGAIIWQTASGNDNGRGVADDIYAGSPGAEAWSAADTTLRSAAGASLGREPGSANFVVWWDGDPVRELLDGTAISKYGTGGDTRLLTGSGVTAINGTKSNPSLSGDVLGDWREEVIWPTSNNTALRIYSTPVQTDRRIITLVHDPMYRVAIAWQNTCYNQPPHPSFFIGNGM